MANMLNSTGDTKSIGVDSKDKHNADQRVHRTFTCNPTIKKL